MLSTVKLANATKLVVILAIPIFLPPSAHPRTILLYFLLSNIDVVGVIRPGIPRSRIRNRLAGCSYYIEIGGVSLRIARGGEDTILPTL